jgi:hypothetical protein
VIEPPTALIEFCGSMITRLATTPGLSCRYRPASARMTERTRSLRSVRTALVVARAKR